MAPVALAMQVFQNVPSLSFSLLGAVKPGTTKKEEGKAGALGSLISPTHATSPPAPTRLALCKRTFSPHRSPARPRGLTPGTALCLGIGRHEEAKEPRALQRPRKRKATARQLHSIKCGNRAKVRHSRLAKEREQKCPVPGQLYPEHRGGRQRGRKASPSRLRRGKKNLRRA